MPQKHELSTDGYDERRNTMRTKPGKRLQKWILINTKNLRLQNLVNRNESRLFLEKHATKGNVLFFVWPQNRLLFPLNLAFAEIHLGLCFLARHCEIGAGGLGADNAFAVSNLRIDNDNVAALLANVAANGDFALAD